MSALRLTFPGLPDCPALHLSVDGMTERGPNLSHWPGNRTPSAWKADLSTGICLRYARASAADQARFLAGAEAVLNDHYDTDGFGSLLAVLHPQIAFAHEETLLMAAATGDFGTLSSPRAFAIDRIVAGLAGERSPYAGEFRGLEPGPRSLARYRFLLEHAEAILTGRLALEALWREEHARIESEVAAARSGALTRTVHHEHGFSVLTMASAFSRMTLNTLAAAFRVLQVVTQAKGNLYRYHDRTESWFELVTIAPPPRRDMRKLAGRLSELETRAGASSGEWCADAPNEPIPELYHGVPGQQEYGSVTRVLAPSALPASVVEREFVAFFAEGA